MQPIDSKPLAASPRGGLDSIIDGTRALIQKLNNTKVGGVGLVSGLGSVAVVALRGPVEAVLLAHSPTLAFIAAPWLDLLANAAMATLPASIAAAYAGMPKGLAPREK